VFKKSKHDKKVALCDKIFEKFAKFDANNAGDDDDDATNGDGDAESDVEEDDNADEDDHIDEFEENEQLCDITIVNVLELLDAGGDLESDESIQQLMWRRNRVRRAQQPLLSPCPHCNDAELTLRPKEYISQHIEQCRRLHSQQLAPQLERALPRLIADNDNEVYFGVRLRLQMMTVRRAARCHTNFDCGDERN